MKKYALLLLAGTTIGLASCGNEENTTTTAQIDSMATYRTDTMEAALRAQNDSLINELARMRADSAMRAEGAVGQRPSGTTTTSSGSRTTRPTTTSRTTTTNTKTTDGRLNIDKGTKANDGRLDIDKNTQSKDKDKTNDGRLKID